eukprot:TRINITY_DN3598_c0_g2_i1.p1 TRINITY_DN3598_c0_g2~~TRINITY_DN3598_c0_g2_i1.p1  ORF type:complete len:304 (-),score=60.12 TRINITY_DN3598_c0_g2_i1:284-1195(-)
MEARYNLHSPSVQRILKEIKEIHSNPSNIFCVEPLENNIFEWHFTFHGCGSDFEGGIYHGKVLLPNDYPFTPPDIIFLTPNGRFEVGKKICLTISSHHAETWQPSWSVRTVILAIISFMPSSGDGAIASLDYPTAERQRLAKKSLEYRCKECGSFNLTALPPLEDEVLTLPEPNAAFKIKSKEHELRDDAKKAAAGKSPTALPTSSAPLSTATSPAPPLQPAAPEVSPEIAPTLHRRPTEAPAPGETPRPNPTPALPPVALPTHDAVAAAPSSSLGNWLDVVIVFLFVAIVMVVVKSRFYSGE